MSRKGKRWRSSQHLCGRLCFTMARQRICLYVGILVFFITMNIIFYFQFRCVRPESRSEMMSNLKHGMINVLPNHHFHLNLLSNKHGKDSLEFTVPPVVHYIWCGEKQFQFKHSLSVVSAYKFLRPTQIIFHYRTLPLTDDLGYYQFYDSLLTDIPSVLPVPLESSFRCENDIKSQIEDVKILLGKIGGMFLGMDVILSEGILMYVDKMLSLRSNSDFFTQGIMLASPGSIVTFDNHPYEPSLIECVNYTKFSFRNTCAIVEEELFPYQIFDLQTDFGELARTIGYGSKTPLIPGSLDTVIPNIVHYVWLGKNIFSFFNYLSLISAVYVQKADHVFIHGDYEPIGEHWNQVKMHAKITFIEHEFPASVFGTVIRNPSHGSDHLRLEILLRYGGVYTDWDILWVNPLTDLQRKHEAVACVDWVTTGFFPDVMNLGILGAQKGSTFVKFTLESFRYYIERHWSYNAVHMPYKVYEQHPESLLVDRHLQVICYQSKCHPAWKPGSSQNIENNTDIKFDWKTETNILHWTTPDPPEFQNLATLKKSVGMFADIGRFVLKKAKLL